MTGKNRQTILAVMMGVVFWTTAPAFAEPAEAPEAPPGIVNPADGKAKENAQNLQPIPKPNGGAANGGIWGFPIPKPNGGQHDGGHLQPAPRPPLEPGQLVKGKEAATIEQNGVTSCTFSHDGKKLYSTSTTNFFCYNATNGKEVYNKTLITFDEKEDRNNKLKYMQMLNHISQSPDGKQVIASGWGTGYLVNTKDGSVVPQPGFGIGVTHTQSYGFSPNGTPLAYTVKGDDGVFLHNVANGKELRKLGGDGTHFTQSPDGHYVAEVGPHSITLNDFVGKSSRYISVYQPPVPPAEQASTIMLTAFSPDNHYLAVVTSEGKLRVIEIASGQSVVERPIRIGGGPKKGASGDPISFSPDGRFLQYTDGNGRPTVFNWAHSVDGNNVQPKAVSEEPSSCFAISPDGKHFAIGEGKGIRIVNASDYFKEGKRPAANLTADQLKDNYGLLKAEAPKSFAASRVLVSGGNGTVAFLGQQLAAHKYAAPQEADVAKLIFNLGNDSYKEREKASQQLVNLGKSEGENVGQSIVYQALFTATRSGRDLETRRRAESALQRIRGDAPSSDFLQRLRAVETLGQIGTPLAVQTLTQIGAGTGPVAYAARRTASQLALRPHFPNPNP